MFTAQCDRGENVFGIARDHHSDRNLAVVRTVGRIQGAAAGVKTDLSAQMASESGFKRDGVNGLRAGSQSAG
jgi:hypothetical protein